MGLRDGRTNGHSDPRARLPSLKKALMYFLDKQGSKGKEIKYTSLKMAEYLSPNYDKISIAEQRYIFAIRNRMVQIEANFPSKFSKNLCFCGNEAN